MNIYHIDFTVRIEVDDEGNPANGMEENEKTHFHDVEGSFDLGAVNLAGAYLLVTEYLDNGVGEGEYDITGITLREDVEVMNWPGGDECQCPSCRTERAAEEDTINFKCFCGYEIKIIDDFGEIKCPSCQKVITRDRVVGSGGNYILLNV